MNRGDELRNKVGGNAVAILAINGILKSREEATGSIEKPFHDHAYILKSLKHVDESEILRKIYGNSFWLISTFVSREKRIELLSKKLGQPADAYREYAEKLINRDYHDEEKKLGQDMRETFPDGDVFIDASHPAILKEQINRFIELIFDHPFHTPYKEEYGMFHAYASSLRSSSMSRQVGAAIMDKAGILISTGTNEVPKAGGGIYTEEDKEIDSRKFVLGRDSNHQEKINMLKDVFSKLKKSEWFSQELQKKKRQN